MCGEADPIRAWSRDKLSLLERYLGAYSRIMSKQKQSWLRSYSYIDAFAGAGRYLDEDTREYVDGSPFVALRCIPPFDEYRFIERSSSRLGELRARVEKEFPGREMRFYHGDANDILRQISREITYGSWRRAFVFLDPYGLELEYSTVCSLAEAHTFDVFVNFSVMGINRILQREKLPSSKTVELLQRVMGDSEWLDELYAVQPALIESHDRSFRGRLRAERVASQYAERVRRVFPHVSHPVLMRNSRDAPLYVLFLASHNGTAAKITNDIFSAFEQVRTGRRTPL
ncbi:MAG: three-Cys-motif partner protein TcmP [Anaerolineae bacterium]|nr:three-Cys-motif partner protein TcmP [Anaerolineae bacterium]